MDEITLTPYNTSSTMTSTQGNRIWDSWTTQQLGWTVQGNTLKARQMDLNWPCPRAFAIGAKQASVPMGGIWAPFTGSGQRVIDYTVPTSNLAWTVYARRVTADPVFGSELWAGGTYEELQYSAVSMYDHLQYPCTFEIDEATKAATPSWAYDLAPTHHGAQGLYSSNDDDMSDASIPITEPIKRIGCLPGGNHRIIRINSGVRAVHHVPTNDILLGIDVANPSWQNFHAVSYFHRAPITFRVRSWAYRQVASGAGDPGPPPAMVLNYWMAAPVEVYPMGVLNVNYVRSGGMVTIGSYDHYGYIADITIDPATLSPPVGTTQFYIQYATYSGSIFIEQKLALNCPYGPSLGLLQPSVYFPGRGIKVGNLDDE